MEQKDLLAEFVVEKRKHFYLLLSFVFFLITVLLFVFLMSKVPLRLKASESVPVISKSLVVADYVSCFAGNTVSMMSIIKREKPAWLKITGTTLNVMMFVFLIWLLCFWLLHLH